MEIGRREKGLLLGGEWGLEVLVFVILRVGIIFKIKKRSRPG